MINKEVKEKERKRVNSEGRIRESDQKGRPMYVQMRERGND
jgi:hypothetical protein